MVAVVAGLLKCTYHVADLQLAPTLAFLNLQVGVEHADPAADDRLND